MDVMIDIETCGTGVDACILTVAAQCFDPLQRSDLDQQRTFYARVDPESQPDRNISEGTIEWWAKQPKQAQEEAFGLDNRIALRDVLSGLHKLVWHCNRVWANGPTFDCNILEHAYKSHDIVLPWQYYKVRDARTVYGLAPHLEKYPASHHALEDCRRQIYLLWDALESLKIKELV